MSAAFDFDHLDSFIPGAVGEPGDRVFYLQARQGQQVVTFRLEKEQVGMLGRYLGQLAGALGAEEPPTSSRPASAGATGAMAAGTTTRPLAGCGGPVARIEARCATAVSLPAASG